MNPAKDADQEIEFFTTPPASKSYGKVLLRNSDMTILENPDRYVILFPQMSNIHQVHMSLDGSYVRFYCTPETSESAQENIFHAIRLFFLFAAQKHGNLPFILHRFFIKKKHGCSPDIPVWVNQHTPKCGMIFCRLHI